MPDGTGRAHASVSHSGGGGALEGGSGRGNEGGLGGAGGGGVLREGLLGGGPSGAIWLGGGAGSPYLPLPSLYPYHHHEPRTRGVTPPPPVMHASLQAAQPLEPPQLLDSPMHWPVKAYIFEILDLKIGWLTGNPKQPQPTRP